MAVLANTSKRWHIVLRCTICGPLGLLLHFRLHLLNEGADRVRGRADEGVGGGVNGVEDGAGEGRGKKTM